MNITFFIGNGFDINLGYKTKYKDFYDYYTKKYPDDLLAKEIANNYENWSDLEVGLGYYYKFTYHGDEESFIQSKNRMDNALSEYLTEETKRRIVFTGDAAQEFQNSIVHVNRFLSAEDGDAYRTETENSVGSIHYCFISFNYTDSLDQIIRYSRENVKPFATHRSGTTSYNDYILEPIHIHGTTTSEMVLGVNDIGQMSNLETISDDLTLAMIKPEINENLGNRRNDLAKEVIDASKYVFIYGMSLGSTDQRWWVNLFEWLKKDPKRKLVIFHFSTAGTVPSGGQTAQTKNAIKLGFFNKVKASQDERDKYKKQVIVQINSPIFSFKKIKLN